METSKKRIKIFFTEIIETIVGAIIMAIATSLILLPNQLSTGGFAGIATIFYYFLNIPMGTTILSINIVTSLSPSLQMLLYHCVKIYSFFFILIIITFLF